MPNDICNKDHSAILPELENLDISQAFIRGRHRCPGCAYQAGFRAGQLSAGSTPAEVQELIQYLKNNLADYEITLNGEQLHFKCDSEKFETDHSLAVLLAMHRAGEIERMFLMPAIVPN